MTGLYFQKVAVLGVGLIGASFSLAIKKRGLCGTIAGFGRTRLNLEKAKDRGIIDSFETDPAAACKNADLIMLSAPAGAFTDLIRKTVPALKKGALVTDVGSVKGTMVHDIEAMVPEHVSYVGGHPIAGSDRSGIETANPELFSNAKCVITPTARSDQGATEKIIDLWKALGATVITMAPEKHDHIFSAVSHLPHLIAYAMINTVDAIDRSYLEYCGQGFRDTTRIASSSPELWKDICLLNKENLIQMIPIFQKNLDAIGQYLKAEDSGSLEREFRKARTLREGIGQR